MKIDFRELSADALQGVIEEFITREGTDYGPLEYDLAGKVKQVRAQLEAGKVWIEFDPDSGSCTLRASD